MKSNAKVLVILLVGALGAGCGDEDDDRGPADGGLGGLDGPNLDVGSNLDGGSSSETPPGGAAVNFKQLVVRGKVVTAGGAAAVVAGALVTVSIDRDKNGVIDADEARQSMSAADGTYAVEMAVNPGETAVVKIAKEGLAPIFRTIDASGGAEVTVDASAVATATMACAAGKCTGETRGLAIDGLPEGTQAAGMALNPAVDTDKFPGAFDESTGALLKSAVFAAIELKDASGQLMKALPTPAVLRLQVPADTWSLVSDTKMATDRIEVPLYSFDEVKGTWVADGEGYLEDAMGMPIPESMLAQIRSRAYAGTVVARGEVTHASYWNVDWPLRTHGCLTGTIVDELGRPLPGAALFAGGVDYTASYRTETTSATGGFCLDVLRAEAAGEDVDGDGTVGDKHQVALHVQYGPRLYLVGALGPGTTEAVCGGTCTDVGLLSLTPAKEVKTALEGHWAGDWGDMVLRKVGEEYWGVYAHDTGTVVLRPSPDGVYRGWWSEVPSRAVPSDAGDLEFRFAWTGTELTLDGRWRYGVTGAFNENWDLKHVTTPVPAGLEERFADVASFKRHP